MRRDVYRIDIDRVVVVGADTRGMDAGALRELVESAIAHDVAGASLPNGRTMRASVRLDAASLAGGGSVVAKTVSTAVTRAIGGRT